MQQRLGQEKRGRLLCPMGASELASRRAQAISIVDSVYPPRPERAMQCAARTVGLQDDENITWGTLELEIASTAAGLVAQGVRPGDRVAVIASTCVRWTVADMAILLCGGVSVPLHPDCSIREYEAVCIHADIRVVFVGSAREVQRLRAMRGDVFRGLTLVQIMGTPPHGSRVVDWNDFIAAGKGHENDVEDCWRHLRGDQLATIMYTSGALGEPKGAVFDHHALLFVPRSLARSGAFRADDVQMLFAPLSHSLGRMLQMTWLLTGHVAAFTTSEEAIDAMLKIQPTVIAAGPRFYERFLIRLLSDIAPTLPGGHHITSIALGWLTEIGHDQGGPLGSMALVLPLLRWRYRRQSGGRLQRLYSGMVPLAAGTWHAYRRLGVELLEGYGLTEAGSMVCMSRPGASRVGHVGRALRGTDVRLGPGAQVQVRGPSVMRGYWRKPKESALVLHNGWLHTDDVGEIDPDGFLRIVGRARDVMVMGSGRHVFPDVIEARLVATPWILHALVHGAGRPYVSALLTLCEDAVQTYAKEQGLGRRSYAELVTHPGLRARIAAVINAVNATLPEADRIQRFHILPNVFSASGGELTPTGKLRRSHIESRYRMAIEGMYQ